MLVYEDNFGFSNINEPEERAFFDFVRGQSVLTACERCERPVRLIPPKALCASCTSALEYGAPASMREYGYSQKTLLDPSHPAGRSLLP
jgi:ribosomal protein L37E